MSDYAKIKLSALRDIGWEKWDPIGLAPKNGGWPEDCADEYDSYLTHAAGLYVNGSSRHEVGEYLARIASEHMGLSCVNPGAATLTANAIADYLQNLPDGPTHIS